jgi:hypothetical protein
VSTAAPRSTEVTVCESIRSTREAVIRENARLSTRLASGGIQLEIGVAIALARHIAEFSQFTNEVDVSQGEKAPTLTSLVSVHLPDPSYGIAVLEAAGLDLYDQSVSTVMPLLAATRADRSACLSNFHDCASCGGD